MQRRRSSLIHEYNISVTHCSKAKKQKAHEKALAQQASKKRKLQEANAVKNKKAADKAAAKAAEEAAELDRRKALLPKTDTDEHARDLRLLALLRRSVNAAVWTKVCAVEEVQTLQAGEHGLDRNGRQPSGV